MMHVFNEIEEKFSSSSPGYTPVYSSNLSRSSYANKVDPDQLAVAS